jgi:organic radical activating enzyme
MEYSIPNPRNFCGGNFQDWLEVNLLKNCNAQCSWCIERSGFHPDYIATTEKITEMAIASGKTNIILLGGEPLLYKDLRKLIGLLRIAGKKIWITSNGFLLSREFVLENLSGITGINISIHHHDLARNKEITKIMIDENRLKESIKELHSLGASIRMNCNIISGQIDNEEEITAYLKWAKNIGADKVRFAELKEDDENFIDLAKMLNYRYGLNDDPFTHGCNSDCIIDGVPVNFRQMCGLQTIKRIAPRNPKQEPKQVLYYDGIIYDGWKKENEMKSVKQLYDMIKKQTGGKLNNDEIVALVKLINIQAGEATEEATEKALSKQAQPDPKGCCY